jgi:TonB family protein
LKVKEHSEVVRACYTEALKKDVSLKGKLVVDWDVNDAGDVSRAEVNTAKSTLKSEAINNCLVEKLKSWKFAPAPAPKGEVVSVSYPFSFDKK